MPLHGQALGRISKTMQSPSHILQSQQLRVSGTQVFEAPVSSLTQAAGPGDFRVLLRLLAGRQEPGYRGRAARCTAATLAVAALASISTTTSSAVTTPIQPRYRKR